MYLPLEKKTDQGPPNTENKITWRVLINGLHCSSISRRLETTDIQPRHCSYILSQFRCGYS